MRGTSRAALAAGTERIDALLDATPAAESRAALGEALFAVVAVLDREAALRRALSDPAAAGDRKAALVAGVFGDQVSADALEVVNTLARQRWSRQRDFTDALWSLAVLAIVAGAEAAQRLGDLEDEIFRFSRIVDAEPALRAALSDPRLPADRKRAVVDALLSGVAQPETVRLVDSVVTDPRGHTLDDALEEVGRIAARRRQRLIATVRVAAPLDDAQHQRMADSLARLYGRPIQLNIEIDPTVVGGAVIRVGDDVIDGSVSTRLAVARHRIAD